MKVALVLSLLTTAVAIAQESGLELGRGAKRDLNESGDAAESVIGLPLSAVTNLPPELQILRLGRAAGEESPGENDVKGSADALQPTGALARVEGDSISLGDPEQERLKSPERTGRVWLKPLAGEMSALASAAGGGVTSDEPLESYYGEKALRGLDAVPDHEIAAGVSVPVGRAGRVGLLYREIQPDARWGTSDYWGPAATPVRVEHDQDHGVVLFFRLRF